MSTKKMDENYIINFQQTIPYRNIQFVSTTTKPSNHQEKNMFRRQLRVFSACRMHTLTDTLFSIKSVIKFLAHYRGRSPIKTEMFKILL
jgi:hypothetical protein